MKHARPLTVTERSSLGEQTLRWKPATFIPGKVSPALSAIQRYHTWKRVA